MSKVHLENRWTDSKVPFCANRVDMSQRGFKTTTEEDEVTCRLCMMRLGLIPDTRGNKDNRS